jgi:sulfite exporter TauE/SafE
LSTSVSIALGAGAAAGLFSTVHCAAMCGPLAASQGVRAGARATALYAGGRILSYGAAGALAGASGRAIFSFTGPLVGALLSAAFAAALLVMAVRLWRPPRTERSPRERETTSHRMTPWAPRPTVPIAIGKRRRPLAARVISAVRPGPFAFGALTALLPCGALWAALALAAGTGAAADGATAMLGFAGASSLGLLAGGWLGAAIRRRPLGARRALAVLLVAGALIAGLRPITAVASHGKDEVPPCHRLLGAGR